MHGKKESEKKKKIRVEVSPEMLRLTFLHVCRNEGRKLSNEAYLRGCSTHREQKLCDGSKSPKLFFFFYMAVLWHAVSKTGKTWAGLRVHHLNKAGLGGVG